MVKCRLGTTFFWGTTRPATEAHMRPIVMAELEGRDIQHVGASKYVVVVVVVVIQVESFLVGLLTLKVCSVILAVMMVLA